MLRAVADEFLKYLSDAAKYSNNIGSFENQKQKFIQEFKIMDLKDSDQVLFEYVRQKAQLNEQVTKTLTKTNRRYNGYR